MARCSFCGHELPEVANFCLACGVPVTGAQVRYERKVVSVLFCDLVGSTGKAEVLDPEDVSAALDAYHSRVHSAIRRYGGRVEKFIGDGIMAVFGAPNAYEDHAERAVRAALEIREWARGDGPELRVAVASGPAVVAMNAHPERGDQHVVGDVVNVAARLQSAAPVNGVLVAEEVARQVRDAIRLGPPRRLAVRGRTEPVVVREPLEAITAPGEDARPMRRGPLLGRDAELSTLLDALGRSIREREPQLITVLGVPGIGKSRLVAELEDRAQASGTLAAQWVHGRALPYGGGGPYRALTEIVRSTIGALETDPPARVADKLGAATARMGAEGRIIAERLGPLVGTTTSERGPVGGPESPLAWRRFFELLAGEHPLVLVFEDLHWADETLLDFVETLVDWTAGAPILVVGTARPELLSRRPAWAGGKSNALTISLPPLNGDDVERLFNRTLGQRGGSDRPPAVALDRSGGNPLFVEELARLVVDGQSQDRIPDTIQGIIAARIDRLPSAVKEVLLNAAVVGKVFWAGSIPGEPGARDEALLVLIREDLVRRRPTSSVAGDTEYVFRHALVRDVAYDAVSRSDRAEKHLDVARWVEGLGGADDHEGIAAHHYLAAIEYRRAAGSQANELLDAAIAALAAAGERSLRLGSFGAASTAYEHALALAPPEATPARARLLLGLAIARKEGGEDAAIAQEALDAFDRLGDHQGAARALLVLADRAWRDARRDDADRLLASAYARVATPPRSATDARVISAITIDHMLAGRNDEAIAMGRQALELATNLEMHDVVVATMNGVALATARRFPDRAAEAVEMLQSAIDIARAHLMVEGARVYNNLGVLHSELGDCRQAAAIWEEGIEFAERFRPSLASHWIEAQRAPAAWWAGAWDDALREAEEIIANGSPYQRRDALEIRGRVRLGRGDLGGALADADESLAVGRGAIDPQALPAALAFAARVRVAEGDRAAANDLADEIVALGALAQIPTGNPPACDLAWVIPAIEPAGGPRTNWLYDAGRLDPRNPWNAAVAAMLDGDLVAAAERYHDIGHLSLEAEARLEAARMGLRGARVDAAEEFYRRVRAEVRAAEAASLQPRAR